MKAVFDLAKKYYPQYWNKERLDVLLAKKKLTQEEYDELIKNGEDIDAILESYPKLTQKQILEIKNELNSK